MFTAARQSALSEIYGFASERLLGGGSMSFANGGGGRSKLLKAVFFTLSQMSEKCAGLYRACFHGERQAQISVEKWNNNKKT